MHLKPFIIQKLCLFITEWNLFITESIHQSEVSHFDCDPEQVAQFATQYYSLASSFSSESFLAVFLLLFLGGREGGCCCCFLYIGLFVYLLHMKKGEYEKGQQHRHPSGIPATGQQLCFRILPVNHNQVYFAAI